MKLKISSFICILLAVFMLTSCKEENETTESSEYLYQHSGDIISSLPETDNSDASDIVVQPGSTDGIFAVDNSWQSNYSAEVDVFFYEPAQGVIKIKEMKSENAFRFTDDSKKIIHYYVTDGSTIDQYIINEEDVNTHAEKNEVFNVTSSTFIELTKVDADLNERANVLYMGDERIASRNCHKYISRAYVDGKLTDSVYFWIDIEFGFCMKNERYDESGNLVGKWVVTSFTTGNVTDEEVKIDISDYSFEETDWIGKEN